MDSLAKINIDLFNITKFAYLICSNEVCTNNSLAVMLLIIMFLFYCASNVNEIAQCPSFQMVQLSNEMLH